MGIDAAVGRRVTAETAFDQPGRSLVTTVPVANAIARDWSAPPLDAPTASSESRSTRLHRWLVGDRKDGSVRLWPDFRPALGDRVPQCRNPVIDLQLPED